MVQGYYSLDEAAQILGMSTEQLGQMAQKREVRAFADRGTWRFRTQDVEELARQRGRGSEPDLQFSDPIHSPKPAKKAPLADSDPIPLLPDDSEQVQFGLASGDSGKLKGKGSSKGQSGKSPTPKPGSDSDVRLVPEGSGVGFQIASDSGARADGPKSNPKKSPVAPEHKSDSSVRIVPMESDSDVRVVNARPEDSAVRLADDPIQSGTDSDIRLELSGNKSKQAPKLPAASDHGGDDSVLTEEIDLDAELRRKEEASRIRRKKTQTASRGAAEEGQKTPKPGSAKATDSSSDFELKPIGHADQPTREEEIDLGLSAPPARGDSGIRLHDPKDSGISLERTEEASSDLEFELKPEVTPKPAAKRAKPVPPPQEDADSEFELTLEDSGGLKPIDSDARGPADSDKDIFATDFEVPALEDDSGSEAVALEGSDTDLESSEFELAIGDEDMVAEDESGSQVVALDDEEADEAAATVARTRGGKRAQLVDEEDDDYLEGDDDDRPVRAAAADVQQSWGVMVPIFAGLTFLVVFVAGLMSFELVHGMWGYRQSSKVGSVIVDPLTRGVMPDNYLPKE